MLTLHVEAMTVKELMAKTLVVLGAIDTKPAVAPESAPAISTLAQAHASRPAAETATVCGPEAGAEPVAEPPKKNKGGRKKQTDTQPEPTVTASETVAEVTAAQPAVASNTGSTQEDESPSSDGAVDAAGADTQEISQPAADVTLEQLNDKMKKVSEIDGGNGIRDVSAMLHKIGGYARTREVTDQRHRNALGAVADEIIANPADFVANPSLYLDKLVP